MKYSSTLAALSAVALAEVIQVQVGPGLNYSPDTVQAADGDTVSFKFGAGHNVVSGSFDSPCQPSGGIYSGNPSEGQMFNVEINGTDPIWIYCSVPHHCQGGMAMVINPPSDHTLDDYKSAAQSVSSSDSPSGVEGGTFGTPSSGSSASSSSAAASSMTSSASAAASSSSAAASSMASSASASMSSAASSASGAASSASAAASSAASSASAAATSAAASSGGVAPTAVPFGGAVIAAAGLMAML